jgi:transcriptional regulator with GAF, ATPase, and Fis domain/Tfp pilus assembly protein PilF
VQRAIPPDPAPASASLEGALQRETIGDLHFAADNFSSAIEEYASSLRGLPGASAPDQVRLLCKLADAHRQRGEFDLAVRHLNEAREAARRAGDALERARVAWRLARSHQFAGRYRHALHYAHYAYRVLRDTGEHQDLGYAELVIGGCHARRGRNAEAIDWLQNALASFRRADHAAGMAMALSNLGLVYKNMREWREAMRFLEQALRLDERAGLYVRQAHDSLNLGLVHYRTGEWDLAEELFRRSLQIFAETGDRLGESQSWLARGLIYHRRRQFEQAEESFRAGLNLSVQNGYRREHALAREFLGELALERGAAGEALRLLESALADMTEIAPEGDVVLELLSRLGRAQLAAGDLEHADQNLRRAAILATRLQDKLEGGSVDRVRGMLAARRGDAAKLDEHMRAAVQVFEELGDRYELAVALLAWADSVLALPPGARRRAMQDSIGDGAKRAATLFRQLGVLPLAAEALLVLARWEAERERYDQALGLLEQAETWISESGDPDREDRVSALRREIEQLYVAVSLSTCNEFRALEEANRLFRTASDMPGLLSNTLRLAVENAGGDRGFVAFSAHGSRLEVVVQHAMGRDRARRILGLIEEALGPRLVDSGPMFSSRVVADPRFTRGLSGPLEGVGSMVVVPLNFPSQAVGLVYVDRLTENLLGPFKQRELNLLAVLANSAAVAIVETQRSALLEENVELRRKLKPTPGIDRVIGHSREMQEILELLAKVSDTSATILFLGETGTGKGLLAHVVHELSSRRDRPFVAVNCAALPEQLLESELFGYVQGAFTGAVRDKVGLFEEAEGGTIFLDEVEKVTESVQAKLLHVLDRGEVRPVGATRAKKVDARVICATNVDLRERIQAGRFLEDLYYRLNDITVRVPALRDRREDVPVLAKHFLAVYSRQMEKPVAGFSADVLRLFMSHGWRGNVRELEKIVKRMVVLAEEGDTLDLPLLPPELRDAPADRSGSRKLRSNVAELERRMIADALEGSRWNKARAARQLGLSYPTLLSKIRTLRIERRRPQNTS